MKAIDLRKKTVDELNTELQTLLRDRFNYRMQRATTQLSQSHQIRQVKRDVARIKTIIREKAGN